MSFLGLFGHKDQQAQQGLPGAPQGLPSAPPSLGGAPSFAPTPQLPAAPPPKAPSLFDKQHRQDTLLAIGSGLLSGFNFSDGVAAAGQNVMGMRKQLRAENTKQHEFGGPDNAFEITIDPRTGERTATPVAQFQDYLEQKRVKQKDVADINGRAMYQIEQLPPEQRAAAYAHMIEKPDYYGIDPRRMPSEYDPIYSRQAAGMGQNVTQALQAQSRNHARADTQDYRAQVQTDRETRTGIYANRAAATTRQGDARLAQGSERIGISRSAKSGGGGGHKAKVSSHNSDLSYLLQ